MPHMHMDTCRRSKLTPCDTWMGRFGIHECVSFIWWEVGGSLILKNQPARINKRGPVEPTSGDSDGVCWGRMEKGFCCSPSTFSAFFFLGINGLLDSSSSCCTTVLADRLATRSFHINRTKNQWIFFWRVGKSWSWTSGGGLMTLVLNETIKGQICLSCLFVMEKLMCKNYCVFWKLVGKPHPPGPRMTLVWGGNLLLTLYDSWEFLEKSW